MEDIFKSIKAFLYERNASPLFGSFLISAIALNYRLLIVAFSDSKAQVKISLIDQLLDQKVDILNTIEISNKNLTFFIYPALLSIFYIFIYPLLAKPAFEYSLKKQTELRKIKQKVEDTKLLTIEESREIRLRLAKITDEYNSEIRNYQNQNQIQTLNKRIEELEQYEPHELYEEDVNFTDTNESTHQSNYNETMKNIDKLPDGEYFIDSLIHTQDDNDNRQKTNLQT